jgi:signal recognition particle subunit SEC65
MVETSKALVKSKQQMLQQSLEQANINISVDVDITNPKEYAKIEKAINERENDYIKQVEARLDENPWNDSIKYEIEALKKDKEGRVSISKYNAVGITQTLLEAKSVEVLQQKQDRFSEEQMKKSQKPINKRCLLGSN